MAYIQVPPLFSVLLENQNPLENVVLGRVGVSGAACRLPSFGKVKLTPSCAVLSVGQPPALHKELDGTVVVRCENMRELNTDVFLVVFSRRHAGIRSINDHVQCARGHGAPSIRPDYKHVGQGTKSPQHTYTACMRRKLGVGDAVLLSSKVKKTNFYIKQCGKDSALVLLLLQKETKRAHPGGEVFRGGKTDKYSSIGKSCSGNESSTCSSPRRQAVPFRAAPNHLS